ncbi:MAG: hypothetical protein WCT36_01890 [Candidatus Gracilibacteria bacterium]|jgi:hypothetical protein
METETAIIAIEQASQDLEFVMWLTGLKTIDESIMQMRKAVLKVLSSTEESTEQIDAPEIAKQIATLMEMMERTRTTMKIGKQESPMAIWPT